MDRTIISPYRAEEKELSQILYNKLHGLAFLHPMSEDLRKLLSDEMFVKPNQQAFFHVMHYLFRLIDQLEFKKRFYWPITDRKSESNFRASTVEYLKYLNEKHQLNWTNIKSYLVVMPGGMKFISFMLDFVHFIVKELVKQKEKQLSVESSQQQEMVTESNLQKMCKKDSLFKEMASGFVDSIEVINKSRQKKMEIMTQHLEELAETTQLSLDLLTDDSFLCEFEDNNSAFFEQQFAHRTDEVIDMEKRVVELKECMDKFYSKEVGFKCDKQKLRQQLKRLREEFSLENVTEASLASDDGITINTLIKTFNGIINTIQNELATVAKRPRTGIVHTRLIEIQKDLKDVETQITEFLMVIKSKVKKRVEFAPRTPVRTNPLIATTIVDAGCTNRSLENTLLMKYVATPPIKLEMSGGHHGPSRLSLLDSKVTGSTSTFCSFLAPSRNVRQTKLNSSAVEQSTTDLNKTMNRSKLIDPMQLLRSINKDTPKVMVTPKANISSLGSKWKERQSLFMDKQIEVPATPTITVKTSNGTPTTLVIQRSAPRMETSLSTPLFSEMEGDVSSTSTLIKRSFATSGSSTITQSPMTPFSSNDRTRIARSQLQLLETNSFTGGFGVSSQSASNSWIYAKKLSAVKKVQDASLYFANLSTSPSGRLEPLVTAEDFKIPKLKLNDLSLLDHNISINKSTVNNNDFDTSVYEDEESRDSAMIASRNNHPVQNKNQEEEDAIFNKSTVNNNDFDTSVYEDEESRDSAMIASRNNHPVQNKNQEEEDAIFNVSDSILKDVTL